MLEFGDTLLLILLWTGWCVMHSLLISKTVEDGLFFRFPWLVARYRIFYNTISLVTLVPLAVYTTSMEQGIVFSWDGYWSFFRIGMFTLAIVLFRGGSRAYDFKLFLGLQQLYTGKNSQLLRDDDVLIESGVFGWLRHPWYAGSLLLIWSGLSEYGSAEFVAGGVLSIYLVLGTMLEEKKIIQQFGTTYLEYCDRVPMLFPWRKIVQLFRLR